MKDFSDILKGGDLRSIGNVSQILKEIKNQDDFNSLFKGLFHSNRIVVMRSADAIEKITIKHPEYLKKYKSVLLSFSNYEQHIEFKWHLALLFSRLPLTKKETVKIWRLMYEWASDKNESKIVRVNSLQSLFNILQINNEFNKEFELLTEKIQEENVPSLNARIRKLRKSPDHS